MDGHGRRHPLKRRLASSWPVALAVLGLVIWWLNLRRLDDRLKGVNTSTQLRVSPGKLHVLVTGGAGFIGSHATLLLLESGHSVTIVDNLSRGNIGAVRKLASLHPKSKLKFMHCDLGHQSAVTSAFMDAVPPVDVVMHFAAIAYVGETRHVVIYLHTALTCSYIPAHGTDM